MTAYSGSEPGSQASEAPIVSRTLFRDAMARLAAAVHVVTTDGAGGIAGMTATAVCSVTDDPPTLLVCLNRNGRINTVVRENNLLAINTLAHTDQEIAAIFSGQRGLSMEDRFDAVPWSRALTGAPILEKSLIGFDCQVESITEVGTHTIVFCRVVEVVIRDHGSCLIYWNRGYTTTA